MSILPWQVSQNEKTASCLAVAEHKHPIAKLELPHVSCREFPWRCLFLKE